MSTSLGELDSRVFLGLSPAAEFLQLEDVHDSVIQHLNVRTSQSRTSDINVLLATTDEFTPTTAQYDITSLIGKGIPKWLEVQSATYSGGPWWYPVRSVALAQFNDYQRAGALAVAFRGDDPDNDTEQATQYVDFTYIPGCPCRIRFDRDSQRTAVDADSLLPDNVVQLIVLEAQNSLIPRIKMAAALRLRNDAEGRKVYAVFADALQNVYAQNVIDIEPLDMLWRVWAFRDRSAPTAFTKPTASSQALYPAARSSSWGPYSGSIGGGY